MSPVFYHEGDNDACDGWYFHDPDGDWVGPFGTDVKAMEAYEDYYADPEYDF